MTSTDQATTTAPGAPTADDYDTDTFGIGEACGVCIFPTGPGQICGNVVYANQAKGRLPKYCGQEGQEHWQAQHGTEGNKRHKSDLAGYPRRQLGMTPEDVQALADAEAARRGIGRRLKAETSSAATTPAVAAPVADAAAAPAAPVPDLAEALPESAVDALAELARLIAGRVVATRAEMDAIRADADARVAEVEREAAQQAEALAAERAGLESDRAEAQAARDRAEDEIRQAREARLTTEGQLTEARARIAELERALSDAEARHRAEIADVRRAEEERYDKLVAAFAATRTEPVRHEPRPVADDGGVDFHIEAAAAVAAHPNPLALNKNHHRMLEEIAAGRVYRLTSGPFRGAEGAKLRAEDTRALNYLADHGLITWPSLPTMETTEGEASRVTLVRTED